MQKFKTIFKGFVVPAGYTLTIAGEDGEDIVKYPGEYSGSHYKFDEVLEGKIPEWSLSETTAMPPQSMELQTIMSQLSLQGGEAMFVGGLVRDLLLGKESKDIDIEVYGLSSEKIVDTLKQHGKVDEVGKSFGVIKLTTPEGDYDFSLPRRENKTGEGHRGFDVKPDPEMTLEEAASRRDFTINSMAMTHDGKIIDHYGGVRDLERGILRHVSPKFAEDPLRVLRGFQLAARLNLTVDPKTADMAKGLRSEYRYIPKDRIWGEWEKWALRGKVPSAGITALEQTGWLELYPELAALVGAQQDPGHHPEGDTLVHTKHVVDAASIIADREGLGDKDRLVLMLSALCHDLGKPATAEFIDGKWRAYGHDKAGEEPTRTFLASIGAPGWVVDHVVPLVVRHMAHAVGGEITPRMVRRLSNNLHPSTVQMFAYLAEADHSGRPPLPPKIPKKVLQILETSSRLNVTSDKPKPIVGGRDLMQWAEEGFIPDAYRKPGPHYSPVLDYLFNKQLDGSFTEADAKSYSREILDGSRYERLRANLDLLASLDRKKKEALTKLALDKGLEPYELTEHHDLSSFMAEISP